MAITRFSIKEPPEVGTVVIIRPLNIITHIVDTENKNNVFYNKEGIVASLSAYNKDSKKKDKKYKNIRSLLYVIPVIVNNEYYLIAPESLCVNIAIKNKNIKKTKITKQKIYDKIDKRIDKLKMQVLH